MLVELGAEGYGRVRQLLLGKKFELHKCILNDLRFIYITDLAVKLGKLIFYKKVQEV